MEAIRVFNKHTKQKRSAFKHERGETVASFLKFVKCLTSVNIVNFAASVNQQQFHTFYIVEIKEENRCLEYNERQYKERYKKDNWFNRLIYKVK